jgi:hypothetical protein
MIISVTLLVYTVFLNILLYIDRVRNRLQFGTLNDFILTHILYTLTIYS